MEEGLKMRRKQKEGGWGRKIDEVTAEKFYEVVMTGLKESDFYLG